MADNPTPQNRNVTLDEKTIEIVEKLDAQLSLNNFSGTLRMIIREWAELKRAQKRTERQSTEAQAV